MVYMILLYFLSQILTQTETYTKKQMPSERMRKITIYETKQFKTRSLKKVFTSSRTE